MDRCYEYFRNTKLDAQELLSLAGSKEKFNLNQFGGSLGGPIQKDKTFFFVDYEAKRQRHGIPFTGLVPTACGDRVSSIAAYADFTNDPFSTAAFRFADKSLLGWPVPMRRLRKPDPQ